MTDRLTVLSIAKHELEKKLPFAESRVKKAAVNMQLADPVTTTATKMETLRGSYMNACDGRDNLVRLLGVAENMIGEIKGDAE